MGIYTEDHPQINESWLLKDNLSLLFLLRVILLIFVDILWWFQIYEDDELNFLNLLSNFQYLTLWGLNLLHFYLIFALIDMSYFKIKKKQLGGLWKLEHFLFQFGFATSLTILLLFWVGIFPTISSSKRSDSWFMFNSIAQHGIIFILYYIEYFLNNIHFKWKHSILVGVGCIAYLITNLAVTFSSSRVYKIISWVSGISYAYAIAAVLLTFFHFWVAIKLNRRYKIKQISLQENTGFQLQEQNVQSDPMLIKDQKDTI